MAQVATSPLIARQGTLLRPELTASRARDATRVPALLTQIQAPLVSVAADSAYDKEAVYEAIEAHSPGRRTRVVIPPQRNATLSQNSNTAMQERDVGTRRPTDTSIQMPLAAYQHLTAEAPKPLRVTPAEPGVYL